MSLVVMQHVISKLVVGPPSAPPEMISISFGESSRIRLFSLPSRARGGPPLCNTVPRLLARGYVEEEEAPWPDSDHAEVRKGGGGSGGCWYEDLLVEQKLLNNLTAINLKPGGQAAGDRTNQLRGCLRLLLRGEQPMPPSTYLNCERISPVASDRWAETSRRTAARRPRNRAQDGRRALQALARSSYKQSPEARHFPDWPPC